MTGATIYKTTDASLTTQGIGGTVDLQTVRPLSAERTLTINGSYEQAGNESDNPEFDNTGKRFALSFVEKFADDTIGIAVAYATAESPNNQRKYGVWGYNAPNNGDDFVPAGLDLNNQSTLLDRETISAVLQFQPNDQLDIVLDVLDISYSDSGVLRGFIEPFSLEVDADGNPVYTGSGNNVSGNQVGVNPVLRTDPLQKDGSPARPGRRANDSAIDESGNLPMSSAEIASTIDLLSCLIACARISEPRIPLTAITSTSSATSFVFACCAKALPENIAAETANDIIAGLKILLVFICVCPIILC